MTTRRFVGIAASLVAFAICAPVGAQTVGGGQRAWVDPETGRLGAPPPGALAPEIEGGAAEAPMVVQPGRTSAGGIMIDLSGRPLYALEVTLTPEGTVVTDCVQQGD